MSLNLDKLEKVRELGNGKKQARCPACAEGGGDRTGEHLYIYGDGRFGCCVHPKDKEHRRRIFALAGEMTAPKPMRVRVASVPPSATPAKSIGISLKGFARTLRTGETESKSGDTIQKSDFRTLRTGNSNPRTYAREEDMHTHDVTHTCKGAVEGVLSVLSGGAAVQPPEAAGKQDRLPFLTAEGTLSIPFDSPERYHWWRGGQSIVETIAEIVAEGRHQGIGLEKLKERYGYGV